MPQQHRNLTCTWKHNYCALPMQVFAKADPRVAQFYETGLVPKELWGFGEDLRQKFHTTKSVLLKVQHPCRVVSL